MDLDSKSDLEKRLEGMTTAQKMREFILVLGDMERKVEEIRKIIKGDTN